MHDESAISNELSGAGPEHFLRCVACGYNLFGLGDEPRCPECGLLNVPVTYRQQVYELVDSGKWFYSGFFSPFKKRLPGWWWSLDREGDVKKSFRYAAINILLSALIILLFGTVVGMFHLEKRMIFLYRMKDDPLGTKRQDRYYYTVVPIYPHGGEYYTAMPEQPYGEEWSEVQPSLSPSYDTIEKDEVVHLGWITSSRIIIRPPRIFLFDSIPWIMATWCLGFVPVYVGLFTQVRKGLPEYTRPSRTILAAGNLESYRLIYTAILVGVGYVIYLAIMYASVSHKLGVWYPWSYSTVSSFMLLGALGWVGPLRSDHTKQLVRSRWHAFRIIFMYAFVLPYLCQATISLVINNLMTDG